MKVNGDAAMTRKEFVANAALEFLSRSARKETTRRGVNPVEETTFETILPSRAKDAVVLAKALADALEEYREAPWKM